MMRFTVLAGKGDYQAAYKLAEKVSDDNKSNADLQNELAWRIATDPSLKERDLKLAEKIARQANDATKAENPMILDTLARVMFMQGNKDEAIALQEKAIAKIDGSEKESYVRTLESYKKGALSKSN